MMNTLLRRIAQVATSGLLVAGAAIAIAPQAGASGTTPLSAGCQSLKGFENHPVSLTTHYFVDNDPFNAGEVVSIEPNATSAYSYTFNDVVIHSAGGRVAYRIPSTGLYHIDFGLDSGRSGALLMGCALPPTATIATGPSSVYNYSHVYGASVFFHCFPTTNPLSTCNGSDGSLGSPDSYFPPDELTGYGALDTTMLGAHTYSVTATDSRGYAVTEYYTYTVVKTTPSIVWKDPAAIAYPMALSSTQLNATAEFPGTPEPDIPGTYTYTPALGTILHPGADQTLSVLFTPDDTVGYNSVSATVHLTVTKGQQTVAFTAAPSATYGTAYTPTVTATSGLPVTLSAAGACSLSAGVVKFIAAGTCTLTGNQAGNDDYDAAPTATQTITVAKAGVKIVGQTAHRTFLGLTPTTFTATVTRADDGTPISGLVVDFTVNRFGCHGTSNSAGVVTCKAYISPALVIGVRTYKIHYTGSLNYLSADATGVFS